MRVIDVSYHQGKINWNTVRENTDPSTGIILRAGYGQGHTDEKFYENIRGALLAGFYNLGVYWFSYAWTIDMAISEAEYLNSLFSETVKSHMNLGAYFDWEYDSMKRAKQNGIRPDQKLITDMTVAFCERINQLGFIAGYYVNEDYTKQGLFDFDRLVKYRKWYARYSSKAKPVNSYLHQYTSKATVKGINTFVDMNKTVSPLTVYEVAQEVIDGKWDNNIMRKIKLENAGYDYKSVQRVVNKLVRGY